MKRGVAIVTGASSGIGRALAERAVRAGWKVFAVGRRAERLDELASRLEGATGSIATLALDLRTPQAAQRIVGTTLERFGRIDVLVNNAGGVAVGPIAQQSDDALAEQVQTHIVVPLALTREALPALRESRGHVFFVGSGVARIPVGALGAYPPAKAAVRNLTRIVRNELRDDGIAVTYVDPGAVATEFMTRAGFAGPPATIAASPYHVARKIFAAFETRRSVVNAVPWQTFAVAVGEALPGLTDFLLRRTPQLVGGDAPPHTAIPTVAANESPPRSPGRTPSPPEPPSSVLPSSAPPLSVPPSPVPPSYLPLASTPTASTDDLQLSPLDVALTEQQSRMRKLNLKTSFLRDILIPGMDLEPSDVAMRWAGMPNKNERALTDAVLSALATAGYLERVDPDRYRVVRPADEA